MKISNNIPLCAEQIINEINQRQQAPWNCGRINEDNEFPNLNALFKIINSGITREDFFYQGDLFRIHSPYTGLYTRINPQKEIIISKPCRDGSCHILERTEYDSKLVAFSKSCDFTDFNVYYKVEPEQKAFILHFNTHELFGIDVNAFLKRYDKLYSHNRYKKEQEVLFPLSEEYLVKEYFCTPNQFKYYMRRF